MHFFHRCTSFFMPSEKKNVFGWAASHACTASFMRNTCSKILEFFYPFVAAEHCSRIVLKFLDGFRPLIHLQTTKNGSPNAALPRFKRKVERPWFNVTVGTKELTEQLQNCTVVIRRKQRLAMHAETTVLPTETNATALRIIIDSPLY